MKFIKECNLDGTARYFNAEFFSKIYFKKLSSNTYIVYAAFNSNDTIRLNITPVHVSKAIYLQHTFLKLLLDTEVKIITINALDGGRVDKESPYILGTSD